jgi:alpha-glucoside transport system substrate-binding protein
MRKTKWLVLLAVFALVVAACGGGEPEVEGVSFTLFGAPTGVEGEAMSGFLDVYNAETGAAVQYVGSDDFESQLRIRVEGGDPPSAAFTPQPGSICPWADQGWLISAEDMGLDIDELNSDRSQGLMDLGVCSDGEHYGFPWFPNAKSLVWYHEPTFTAQGYEIPETWDDMIALGDRMLADGFAPFCEAWESGGATGWKGTDWVEEIISKVSPDIYFEWTRNEVPFTDSRVKAAFDKFGELFFRDGFVLGGADNVSATDFRDGPLPMFNDPPLCLMHKQGSFVTNFFPEGGEDEVKFFGFPTIDGNSSFTGGGDYLVVFNTDPGNADKDWTDDPVVTAVTDWLSPEWGCVLASPGGGTASEYGGHGVAGVERLPGHKDISADCYETDINKEIAPLVTEALDTNTFFFDGGDLMDPAVGQGTFWVEMVNWSKGKATDQVLTDIQAGWP